MHVLAVLCRTYCLDYAPVVHLRPLRPVRRGEASKVCVVCTSNRSVHCIQLHQSVHPVSALIPYPSQILIISSQADRKTYPDIIANKPNKRLRKAVKCQRTKYEGITAQVKPKPTNTNGVKNTSYDARRPQRLLKCITELTSR